METLGTAAEFQVAPGAGVASMSGPGVSVSPGVCVTSGKGSGGEV
jgi:hypothetical protein